MWSGMFFHCTLKKKTTLNVGQFGISLISPLRILMCCCYWIWSGVMAPTKGATTTQIRVARALLASSPPPFPCFLSPLHYGDPELECTRGFTKAKCRARPWVFTRYNGCAHKCLRSSKALLLVKGFPSPLL